MTSIKFCDDALLSRLLKIQLLGGYLDAKTKEVKAYNRENNIDDSSLINGRRLTNFGTFRAYLSEYLHHHPKVNVSMTLIIRYLQPTANGIPLELHVFSSDKEWLPYEQVQADIMDHILAVLPYFELRVFQNPCGADITQASKNLAESLLNASNAPR
jgi:miniconductance mechanosensitive channel